VAEGWIGSPQDAAVTDPTRTTGQVTLIALLKGLLAQMQGTGPAGKAQPAILYGPNGQPLPTDATTGALKAVLAGSYATVGQPMPTTVVPIGVPNLSGNAQAWPVDAASSVPYVMTILRGSNGQWNGVNFTVSGTDGRYSGSVGPVVYNGSTFDAQRGGNGSVKQSTITTATTTAVWTPASGKRFRLLSAIISTDTAMRVYLQDATGQIIASFRLAANATVTIGQGNGLPLNGYLSSAANNVLNVVTGAAGNVDVTVAGTEE
jgi:hypothetical protein